MSSPKRQKRWGHKVLEGLLTDDSIFKFEDHITISDDLNDAPLHRKRIFERKVYKTSKIEMKGKNSAAKQKSASKVSDVSLTHRELIAEIDKSLKHLQSQKKFLHRGRQSNQDKTWSEHLEANISLSQKREIQQKSSPPIDKSVILAVLNKLIKEKQVANAGTQSSFRKPKVKLANSSTQVGSSIQGSRRTFGTKNSSGRHSLTTSDSKVVSPTISKEVHDPAERSRSRLHGRSPFQNHQSPGTLKIRKYQSVLTENHVQIENESQKDETKVIYKRRTEKKVVETRQATPKKSHNLPKPQPREELTKHSLNISVEHSTSGSILDSGKNNSQRQSKAQVKFPEEIQNGSDWNVLRPCQKSFPYSNVSLRLESRTIKSDQVIPSAASLGKNCQISSISATKIVESHHIKIAEDFKSASSQNHFKQTLTTSKHILRHERSRWEDSKDSHKILQQSSRQSHDIRRTRSQIVDQSLTNSTPRRSLNTLPNLIDDITYTRPDNDNNKDYIILPYCFKHKEKDLPTGSTLRRTRGVYGQKLTAEDLGKYNQYMKVVEKSGVVLKDVESLNEQNKTEDGTIQDTVPKPQSKTSAQHNADHNRESIPRSKRKSSHSVIGQTENHNFSNKSRTSESRSQDERRVSTKMLDHKSQQTSFRSESNHEHPPKTSISPRERRIDDIALDQSNHKPDDVPKKLETNHERRVKLSKSSSKQSINNLKLDQSDHHSFKGPSPILKKFGYDLRSKASTSGSDYHKRTDMYRRSESSLEQEAEVLTSPLKQEFYELSQLSRHDLKEVHCPSDPGNGREIEDSLSKPETNDSLSNRFDDPKSKGTSHNAGPNQIRESGARRNSDDRKTQAIFNKSDPEQDNRSRALPFPDKQRCFDSPARDENNEQGNNYSSSIKSKSDRSDIQDISTKSNLSYKCEGDDLMLAPKLRTFGSVLTTKETIESYRFQSDKEWQDSVESHENGRKTTKKESYDVIKSESEQIEKEDIFRKTDIDNKLEATYTDRSSEFKQEQEDCDSSASLRRRKTYTIINEIEPEIDLEQEHPSLLHPEAFISKKLPSETKLNLGHSPSQSQFPSINDALPDSSAQHNIHETSHKHKPRFRSISQLPQEPKTIAPKTKSFTLESNTAGLEAIESHLHFKHRSSGNESEIIEFSRITENDLTVKYENPELDLECIDPQIKDLIESLQKQLKNCNEFVKNQLVQSLAVAKENFKDTHTCKLDVKPTADKLEPHKFEAEPVIEFQSEQSESDELELLSAEAQSSGDETCLCCPCCACSARGTPFRSSSEKDSSTHSEIPPFTGCDCMKEDYYKIMQIAYN